MRPKLVALLAVSAIALVGCSATAEPLPEPSATISAPTNPPAATQPEETNTAGKQEEAFLTQLSDIKDKADQLEGNLKKKATDSYLIKRGEKYCDLLEETEAVEPLPSNSNDTTDYQIETMILQSARTNLCPEASN